MEDANVPEAIVYAVRNSMYVDDYLHSAPSVIKAVGEVTVVRDLLLAADESADESPTHPSSSA